MNLLSVEIAGAFREMFRQQEDVLRVDRELRLACRLPIRSDLIVTAPYW